MSITLNQYSAGDTNYVTKLNSDMNNIAIAINSLEGQVATGGGGTTVAGIDEIFDRDGLIGVSSFILTTVSNTHISLTSGSLWVLSTQTRARSTTTQQVNFVGKASGTYFVIVDTAGGASISTASSTLTVYSIVYRNPGFGSSERLVPILFNGDEYQRMLSSVTFGSHTRVADRLSSIEGSILMETFYAQKKISGLTWEYFAGLVRNNNQVFSTATGSFSFVSAASASFYVEVDPTNGVISFTSGDGFTSGNIPIRFLRYAGSSVVSNEDRRTWAAAGGSSGGALTVSGTPEAFWGLNTDVLSIAPTSDAGITVHRGTSGTVSIRWNETNDAWEFTNNGTQFFPIQSLQSLDLGAQRITRFNVVVSSPTVLAEVNRSSTNPAPPPYEELSFSAYTSTTTVAVFLRGVFIDKNPSGLISGGIVPGITFYRDSATIVGDVVAKLYAVSAERPIPSILLVPISNQKCVFQVDASSDFTATIQIHLIAHLDTMNGVGTQRVCGVHAGMSVSAGVGKNFNITTPFDAAMNRGIVYQLTTSGTTSPGSTYDIELYNSSSFSAGGLLFQAIKIDPSATYTTRLPFMYEDIENNATIHLRISNHAATSGVFSLLLLAERFA